ncbi:MAG: efflux RND transporter permease subunit [Alphaproteobacteria bacterium]|nr:efflux RND transporter permease subunit [Alphaproteobacteria bacterium]
MFSQFFIKRPRFAIVIALILSLAGILCLFSLPVDLYPTVTPPEVRVRADYPGASADTVAKTIGIPLEDGLNGVDDMIYMSSTSSDGGYMLTLTFESGTDPDMATVKVQNRIQQIQSLLPTEVQRRGLKVVKASSSILAFISFYSPDDSLKAQDINDYLQNSVVKPLAKVPGVGEVTVYGAKKSMRIWLDADKIASLNLSAEKIRTAIQGQNYQPSLGKLGARPNDDSEAMVYSLQTEGRLSTPKQFENIIIRTNEEGGLLRLADVARIEIGTENYSHEAYFNQHPSVAMLINLSSGANALSTMSNVRSELQRLSHFFPDNIAYTINMDSTDYISASVKEVAWTLISTFLLVIFVVYLFLQDWRMTLVPTLTIPVSLLSTFAVMSVLGYSVNMFTLFGLLLAIGVVVDDAICVTERADYLINHEDMNPIDATSQTMKEISGALIATTLVLLAIFVPIGFLGGITGKIYQQFSVTICVAVCFSTFCALTLAPAVAAHFFKKSDGTHFKPLLWFNHFIERSTNTAQRIVLSIAKKITLIGIAFAIFFGLTFITFNSMTTSFLPNEDQGMILISINLPEGATLGRTDEVAHKVMPIVQNEPAVKNFVVIEGMSMMMGSGENVATGVVDLIPWDERKEASMISTAILNRLRQKFEEQIPEAQFKLLELPAIPGLGISGGLDVKIQSLEDMNYVTLDNNANALIEALMADQNFLYGYSGFTSKTPNLHIEIDRDKAESMNVPMANIFSALETYLGSGYVNDVNFGTQVNKVILQSDWKYRRNLQSLDKLYVPNAMGKMVPIKTLISTKQILAPRQITRYNQYPAAALTVVQAPNVSSGTAMNKLEQIADRVLPKSYAYEWSGMSYQEKQTENQVGYLVLLAVVFAYLFLVAQYESWVVPIPVLMSVIFAIGGGLFGLWISGLSMSIYAQLGLVLLIGLASKNAILVVEFAKDEHNNGTSVIESGIHGLTQRFRAVLMTAFTFILGVLPMIWATGAASGSRRSLGTPVFWGMTIGTILGLIFIPLLYIFVQTLVDKLYHKETPEE